MSPFYIYNYMYDSEIFFYVRINNDLYSSSNQAIAELIDMPFDKYEKLIKSYGAKLCSYQYSFRYKNEAKRFMDYLNDKYLLLLRLQGKI